MESLKDFGECIITIQACVIKKFLQGFMAPKQKKKKKLGGEESSKAEEVDEEKRLAEEARVREQSWNVLSVCLTGYGVHKAAEITGRAGAVGLPALNLLSLIKSGLFPLR